MGPRVSGLVKIGLGVVIALALTPLLPEHDPTRFRRSGAGFALIGPLVALIGIFEVLSGVPMTAWGSNWDYLPGWLKFFIGLFSVVLLLVFIITAIVWFR